jgi:anti-sigma factor RsiW
MAKRPTGGPHAAREQVERYVQGDLPRAERQALERHLAGCVACQEAVARAGDARRSVLWRGHRFAPREDQAPAAGPADGASENLRGVLRGLGTATDAFGASLLAELLDASEHERRALISRDPRFASLPLVERLAGSCRAAWLDDPEAAVELARLAVAIAARLDPDRYGAAQVADARALAWSQLGSSYRIAAAGRAGEGEVAEGGPSDPDDGALYPPARVPASMIGEPVLARDDGSGAAAPLAAALAALEETREACLARGAVFEAALVTLDLAAAHLRRGRIHEAEVLLLAAPGLLATAGLGEESAAHLAALAAAAAAGALAPALLEAAAADLHRARNDPAERFRDGR